MVGMQKLDVIILASGSGQRFGTEIPKQLINYKGKPLLEWSINFFNQLEIVKDIVLVINEQYLDNINSFVVLEKYSKVTSLVSGGLTRQLSSFNGLKSVSSEHVLIHDAARPNISPAMVDRIVNELDTYHAVVPCVFSTNTVYQLDNDGIVKQVLDRANLGIVQTPQAFKTQIIKNAHDKALQMNKTDFTDDASMISFFKMGLVKTVQGDDKNIKVTYQSDLQ